MAYRDMFASVARELNRNGRHSEAVEILDMGQNVMKPQQFPLDITYLHLGNEMAVISMVEQYYKAGAVEKARDLARRFVDEMMVSLKFFYSNYPADKTDFESVATYLFYLSDDVVAKNGDEEFAKEVTSRIDSIVEL